MSKAFSVFGLVAVLLVACSPVCASNIRAEGTAAIAPHGIDRARHLAVLDAKHRAALQAGAAVETASRVSSQGALLESSRVRALGGIGKVSILREWQAGGNFYVEISAEAAPSNTLNHVNAGYKKKIAIAPFTVRKSQVTDDIDNVSHGLAGELLRRLESGGRFLPRSSQYTLPLNQAGQREGGKAVVDLANRYDSQFLISGEVIDAGVSNEGGVAGFFQKQRRRFDIDLLVHDGLTGALIARHRIETSALGHVGIGRDKPFGSASFYSTAFGKAIHQSIEEAAHLISRDLINLPFAARVIRVADDRIYIDAGSTSSVAPGDQLIAYRLRKEAPLTSVTSGDEYGISETPIATVSVMQVQPTFSICALSGKTTGIMPEPGDLVRFEFIGTHRAPD